MLKDTHRRFTAEIARHAETILLLCALGVLAGCFPVAAAAAPPVRSMYNDALAREQALRVALKNPAVPPAVINEIRTTVAAYEAVVRHYPASSYSDNALWQAGRLSLDAFARFGQAPDRDTGIRILRKLAATYPSSRLAKQAAVQLTRLDATRDGPAADVVTESRAALTAPAPPTAAPRSGPLATIKEIRRVVLPDAVRITIELDSEVPFHDERIQDPARVFVDLPGTRAVQPLIDRTLRFEGDADIVRQVRVGRHPNNTTRVVLDAAGMTSYSVYPLYSPYRLVIDCVRVPAAVAAATMTDKVLARVPPAAAPAFRQSADTAAAGGSAPVLLLPARTMTNPWLRRLPGLTPKAATIIALARQGTDSAIAAVARDADTPAPVSNAARGDRAPEPPPVAAAPAHNTTGGLSMARQLGLGVSRIVIDPGHGGHDPGAKGKGVTEAEIVLDVALRLEKLLQKVPGVEVILTRRTDDFIQLPERTAIANREGADLFLSIHANASVNSQAHGIETYFLNFANNQSAAAVAARENAASTQSMGGLPDFVKAIALNNKLDESRDFALHVQRSMVERQKSANKLLKDLGVKQAPFVVLIGANMPSVLAEMGFVTNVQEGKLLKANAYREKIAESLFAAIRKYQTSLKNVSTVAHQ
ncbi:MAG: amiA [Acidobacteria bacterium]|nr:amiA [Acidobacteriota bacterium]